MSKVLCIGDSCVDTYVYGKCERLCPEGPVPVLSQSYKTETLGMAGNAYNNLCVFFDFVHLLSNEPSDITKTRFIDEKTNQLLLRLDANDSCQAVQNLEEKLKGYDLVVVSDYCKGFLTDEDLVKIGSSFPFSVLDSKRKLTQHIVDSFSFIKLNEDEYRRNRDIVEANSSNLSKFVITMGSKGVRFLNKIYPPNKVIQTFDVSGAGDVFTASFASKLYKSNSIKDSIEYAQECCVKVIQKKGTCIYEEGGMD
jgi:bifunctional ADP-heptose synthase (sugar kinase/adenylyltransferase)